MTKRMAVSIRKWECYFATLVIVEFAQVSRLIERDFSRVGGEFMETHSPRRRRTLRVDDRKIRIML